MCQQVALVERPGDLRFCLVSGIVNVRFGSKAAATNIETRVRYCTESCRDDCRAEGSKGLNADAAKQAPIGCAFNHNKL